MKTTFLKKVENAKKLIKTYINKYPKNGAAISFGKDSTVLAHLIREITPDVLFFAVLADTEFPETLALRDRVIKDWSLNYKEYTFVNDPSKGLEECCRGVKVEKFKEAVRNLDCWFSGIRRDEGLSRSDFNYVEKVDGLVKVNPILDFSEKIYGDISQFMDCW